MAWENWVTMGKRVWRLLVASYLTNKEKRKSQRKKEITNKKKRKKSEEKKEITNKKEERDSW